MFPSILLSFLKGVELTTSSAAASEQPDQAKDKRKVSSNEKQKSPSGELKDDQGTPRKSSKTGAVERAMASFVEYQRQADEMYQREIEAQLWREEIKAQKESSEVFASLLSEIYLRAAVRKYRLGGMQNEKIENPQTLSEYRSR